MNKDYYDALNLKRNATVQEIAENYKKLALRWNPKNAKEDQATAYHHFSEVSEAFEVLSDPVKRSFYDKYGWEKLKQGLYADGELKGGYRFGNNPNQIFEKFFHSNEEFAKVLDKNIASKGSMFSNGFGALNYEDQQIVDDLIVRVPCTFSELYQGIAKPITYQRKVLNHDGRSLSIRQQSRLVEIKAGYGLGTVLRIKGEGNESIHRKKSDLVLVIEQIPHEAYTRRGADLIYTNYLTLAEALSCKPLFITTLDNRSLRVGLDQIPSPKVLKEVEGEGMPWPNSAERGNLYIRFKIEFPRQLSEEARLELRKVMG